MKKLFKNIAAAAFCATVPFFATGACRAAMLQPDRVTITTGMVSRAEGESDMALVSVQPELVHGNVSAVLDINMIFDREFRLRDNGNDMVVLDSIALNRERLKLRYGDIEGLTLGRGFIVSNYYSDIKNDLDSNEQKGIVLDTWSDRARFTMFGTWSHLVGGRAERNLGRVNLGATVVLDSDPDLEAYGIDAKLKIVPDKWTVYAEGGNIVHAGNGFVIGSYTSPFPDMNITVTGEYRKFDSDFSPGIVDSHYEARPRMEAVRANVPGKVDGFYWAADFFSGAKNSILIFTEDYEGVYARAGVKARCEPTKRLAFNLFYAGENFVPSSSGQGRNPVVLANLTLGLTRYVDLALDYYRAFDDAGLPLKSLSTKVKFHKKR